MEFKDLILDTEDKQKAAVVAFESLKQHPGWKLLEQVVQSNIDVCTEEILEGSEANDPDEKIKLDRRRDIRRFLVWFKNLPDDQIKKYDSNGADQQETSSDPYPTS